MMARERLMNRPGARRTGRPRRRRGHFITGAFALFAAALLTFGAACEDPAPPVESPCPRQTDAGYVRTANDAGLVQFWTEEVRRNCLTFHQKRPGTADLDDDLEASLIEAALAEWATQAAACGATLCLQLGPPVGEEAIFGFTLEGPNQNVISTVRDTELWRLLGEPEASLAVTLTTYDQFGRLLDADVALNDGGHTLSDDPRASQGTLDFASTILHELGHGLGFAHSIDDEAVMWFDLRPGETRRTLNLTDRAGLCEAYACR